MCVIVILFYTWRMINTKYFYWIGSRHILSVIPEIFQWWPCWPSPSTASLSSIFLQGLLDDGHPLLVSLSCGVSLEGAQLFCSKARDPHVPVPLQDNLNKKDIYEIVNPNTATWTSRTSILFAFLCLASAQAWLTVCSMKSSAIWKFVEIVSLTRFARRPEEEHLQRPRRAARRDQLPSPVHTAAFCLKPAKRWWPSFLMCPPEGTWVSELKLIELVGWPPPIELTLVGRLLDKVAWWRWWWRWEWWWWWRCQTMIMPADQPSLLLTLPDCD